ncbi:MAG: hypothetical protein AB8F74_19790 [Saprospiraceae bacterium]
MNQLITLALTDFKLIFRDPSLRIFLVFPLFIFAIILLGLPALIDSFKAVESFVPIVLMGATIQTSTMFGFIYCMVFIHEKDLEVAKVYGVLPVSKIGYVISRLVIPFVVSTIMTFLLLVVQPFFSFGFLSMVLLSILCGLFSPVFALLVSVLSKNKMEGMTWFKLVNLLTTIPLAAFFVVKYDFLFGIVPTYWAFQALDGMIENKDILLPLVIGFSFVIVLLVLLISRFTKVHFE